MNLRYYSASLLGLLLLWGNSVFSQAPSDSTTENLAELSLEELMNIEVESSTKSSVSIQKAPSVIRVFTKEDIANNGYQTLRDVLNQVPGVQVQEYRAGHQLVWVRGVQARYNNKVLLLIDGVPIRDSYYGNFNIDEMIPLANVEKIEILNGPGSVLYGMNSFSGVISITTKKEMRSVSANYGTWNSFMGNAQYNAKGFAGNVNYFRSDGFSPALNSDGLARTHDQRTENVATFLRYDNKNFTAIGSFTRYQYPYRYRDSKGDYRYTRTPIYGAVRYKFNINENSFVTTRAFVNYVSFDYDKIKYKKATADDIKSIGSENLSSMLYGAEAEYNLVIKKHSIIAGAAFLGDRSLDISAHTSNDGKKEVDITTPLTKNGETIVRTNVGLYVQDVWEINERLMFTGGIRYDYLNHFKDQFNYRGGITAMITEKMYGKLLYGTSFRVPSYREAVDAVTYNDKIQPEHLKTFEAQLGYNFGKADVNITFFNNNYTNFLQEILVDSIIDNGITRKIEDEMSFNFKSRTISGLELYAKTMPVKGLTITAGMSYILKSNETVGDLDTNSIFSSTPIVTGKQDLYFLSRFTVNGSVTYLFMKRFTIGLNGSLFSNRNTPANYQSASAVQNIDNAKGYFMLNAFVSANIVKGLYLTGNFWNITNAKIYSPSYGDATAYDNQWAGFNFRAGLAYKF